jgi:hypothetical protein
MDDLVTIAFNVGPVEMAVLKDRFEVEGIVYLIKDENSVYPMALYGGTKIQVQESDKERALQIMKETGYLE